MVLPILFWFGLVGERKEFKMKFCWHRGKNVLCVGKIFNDGWGMIVVFGERKPIIWKI